MAESASPNTSNAAAGVTTELQPGTPPLVVLGESGDATSGILGSSGAERFRLFGEIARGGMGIVYRARDLVFDRDVGLKTLLRMPAAESSIVSRFREEARITGQLQHPNIPPVHDLGMLPDGRPYLAMKLIKGRTLEVMLSERPHP